MIVRHNICKQYYYIVLQSIKVKLYFLRNMSITNILATDNLDSLTFFHLVSLSYFYISISSVGAYRIFSIDVGFLEVPT